MDIELMWALEVWIFEMAFLEFMISFARIMQTSLSPFLAASFKLLLTFSSSLWIPVHNICFYYFLLIYIIIVKDGNSCELALTTNLPIQLQAFFAEFAAPFIHLGNKGSILISCATRGSIAFPSLHDNIHLANIAACKT